MPYRIRTRDGFFEVRVWGETSTHEILNAVKELDRKDRGKKLPDLWIFAAESQLPFDQHAEIAKAIRSLCPPGMVGNRTAMVADGEFQKAQLEVYRSEASILPFPIRVFGSEDEAVEWLKNPEGPTEADEQ